ncbi:MAG TPA: hypothetical protein PK784_01140 [Tenuifilaceae bacterium]|nr:hypothetical protein [Tenuifilaceae bacterium]
MNALKKLIALKSSVKEEPVVAQEVSRIEEKETYYDSGYNAAKLAHGSPLIFVKCLDDIYEKFKERCREDDKEQQRLNAPYIAEQERQKTELKKREILKSIKDDELKDINESIIQIDSDIANVRNNPEKYGIDATKKPKAQFFIGLLILIPITLYLLVFYISASYSGFFKLFDSNEVIAAIFDANALTKAINDGWLEAVFVCTIPFAFMGLGYLIHMFQKEKKRGTIKVIALFAVTFIFDAILAYQIEKKIYDFDRVLTSEPFNLQIAFTKVEFWGIIFAGFVVYVIWGLVFDFIMKEHDNIDKIRVFINKLKDEKVNLQNRKIEVTKVINELIQEITAISSKISELQSRIDGFIFPNRKYLLYHSEYVKGWYMAISAEIALPHEKKDSLINECEKFSNEHLLKYEVSNYDSENIVYNKKMN